MVKLSLLAFPIFLFILPKCSNPVQTLRETTSVEINPVDTTTLYSSTTNILRSNTIPDEIFDMKNLKHLHIQGMDCDYGDNTSCWMIVEIPGKIANLKLLETLSLNVNAIDSLPDEAGKLENLKLLDLSDNSNLSYIEPVTVLENLEELFLFGCSRLNKLPANMGNLKKLRKLGLTGSGIDKAEMDRIKRLLPYCKIIFSN
jgi:Leucine-rich repeat (LRR) protein